MKIASKKALLPFMVFVVVAVFLAIGLTLKPGEVPSPFIGKAAPEFELPMLAYADVEAGERFASNDLLGQVWLLNVWASWCAACRDEHPLLNQLAQQNVVPIVGLDYKDETLDAQRWLDQFGNPYSYVAVDAAGDIGIEYGVYGVPETFVIDRNGTIQLKHIGPLTASDISDTLLPLVKKLKAAGS